MFERIRGESLVFGRKIIAVATDFAATHFERFRILPGARAKNFRIEHTCHLESLHVREIGKLERVLKGLRIGGRFAESRKNRAEVFVRRSPQRLVMHEGKVSPAAKFREP